LRTWDEQQSNKKIKDLPPIRNWQLKEHEMEKRKNIEDRVKGSSDCSDAPDVFKRVTDGD